MRLSVKFILTALIPLYSLSNYSQELTWKAQWIMHPTVQPQEHAVIIFRKTIVLQEKPDQFIIHLSADNHYRLFVNGSYVQRGPARGDLSHWFYETVDISSYLKQGKNTLAAEVVNWGPKRSFTFFSQMTSFILQGDSDSESIINTYGGSWKCYHNNAVNAKNVEWMTDRSTIDFGLYVGNPTDSVRGELYPWGWEKTDFNDSGWPAAKWCDIAGGRDKQFAGGILYSGGKMLIPRRTPILSEQKSSFREVRRFEGIDGNDAFIHNNGKLHIPAGRKVTILIDNGVESLGYPEMIVSGGRNSSIRAMYAENMIINNKAPKGNRNDISGKKIVGIKDIFLPDGGDDRLFKPSYLRAFRYIQLDIVTHDQPLIINSYYNVECKAPLELKASFKTGNTDFDWIIEAGWRTVSICAQDYLLSDAAYEQMQYTGDSRVHNLSLMTLSGDDRLTRNALIQFDQSRIPEGLTYACYPNPFYLIIPSYSLIWIDQVHDYMMWKDDIEFIKGFEPGIMNVLGWYERKLRPNGLLGKIDWWGALAWPRHYNNGEPPDVYKGNNTLYTLHYAYSLRHAADIFAFTGKTGLSDSLNRKADMICSAVNLLCRNTDGFYSESVDNRQVSQITNIMAVLAGAVRGDEAKKLIAALLEPKDWFGQADLFLHLYLFEALNITGLQDRFTAELSEWRLMKERGLTTFAEVPLEWGEENQRSECHPWSSSPDYFFFRTICGIKPLAPGHKIIEISPTLGDLKSIVAVYPHPLGIISIELTRTGSKISGTVTVPVGIKAVFKWNSNEISLSQGVNKVSL
ncbi:MAG TPA: alpha-L-rhamnosidase C-terminal domain-containing protein [Bacteroidales bacterium]|nr:alpha-L-rhamnosidase C-terminal domain-containing protein [Bacteroidales bacterium]